MIDAKDSKRLARYLPGADWENLFWGFVCHSRQKYAGTVPMDAEDEIMEMWIMARHITSGVPDIRTLVEDADAIQEMLNELASALEEVRGDDENRAA